MPCKLCHRDEPRCYPAKLLVCSQCFQIALRSTPEQIKRAYELAIEEGFPEKAQTIKNLFMREDGNDGLQINVRREPRYASERFNRS
jgi:hypothetical protein